MHRPRDDDAPGLGDVLQPGGHVHHAAEDLLPADHHFAEIDPDTAQDPLVLRFGPGGLSKGILELPGRAQCRRCMVEIGDQAIAGDADDAPTRFGNRLADLIDQGGDAREGTLFVGLQQCSVARDIRSKNRCAPTLNHSNANADKLEYHEIAKFRQAMPAFGVASGGRQGRAVPGNPSPGGRPWCGKRPSPGRQSPPPVCCS